MTIRFRRPTLREMLKAFARLDAVDIDRFARRFNVSSRTIYRDIAAIRSAGYRVPPFAYRGVKA